ncbi:hypothetical protein KIM372_17650 [Bombiscardovia nodaiensis]|uniref:Polysaccharide biosynthesis protein n=1 Tax=Bombiscardovia nodaiensis TaxID=2932181 RepID=A0ABM8BAD2_9BIFI|nr:hypothetical protein KIM372_17650 [Bombiscardovia nodaiensis]
MSFDLHRFDRALFKSIFVFSFWIFLNQITDLVNNQVPNFLLGMLASSSTVAVFSVAMQVRTVFVSMSLAMSNVFVPLINRIVASSDDSDRLTKLMTRVGRYQMILFCFVFGGFVIIGRYFIHLWAGDQNADAYWLALMMILPVGVDLVQNTGIEIQRARNRQKTRSAILVTTATLDVVISIVLIPRLGYWATAIGYVVGMVLGYGILMNLYYHFSMKLDMRYFWAKQVSTLVLTVILTSVFVVLTHFSPVSSLSSFIVWGALYSVAFTVSAWYAVLSVDERNSIKNKLHLLRR